MPIQPSSPLTDHERAAELGRRLGLITSTAGIGYWSLERGQRHATWSDELRRMHGLIDGEPVPSFGDWMRQHVHAHDRESVFETMRKWPARSGDSLQQSFRIVAHDGTVREVQSHTIVEGELQRDAVIFGVVIDLTAIRNAERARREAESRAALATRALGMGTWELDLRSGQAHWDAQMWLLRGREPSPVAPSQVQRVAFVHPDDRAAVLRVGETAAAHAYEFRVVWPDGQVRWIASRSTIISDEYGAPARRIGVNWDITASRAAEAALRERELALRESESRSRMLARMSHELRTPLNAILGFAQLLHAEESGDDDAARRRRAQSTQIEQAGEHLLSLVDKVLELVQTRKASEPAPLPPVDNGVPAPGPDAKRRTVLYIEDNAVNAMIVAELVARRGDLQFEAAATGQEGVARAIELQPALILLDMQLPDIDGHEVFRRLRADPRTAAIPCIALSADAMQENIDAARAAGMADYWTKPLDFRVFAQSLDGLFGPAPQAAARAKSA